VAVHKPEIAELIRAVPKDGGSHRTLSSGVQLDCHKRCDGFFDIYGRMAWDEVAPTITGGCVNPSKGRFLHPRQDRVISLREAALLQTFPLGYRFLLERGKYPAAQMIGNALPPRFVRRHALSVRRYVLSARWRAREDRRAGR
jgi:DNA (cytosine-5)-methyltransferase 1